MRARSRWLVAAAMLAVVLAGLSVNGSFRARASADRFEAACRHVSVGDSWPSAALRLTHEGGTFTGMRSLPLPIVYVWARSRRLFGHQWCQIEVDGAGNVLGGTYDTGSDLDRTWSRYPRAATALEGVRPIVE
jgi:hypothetical protein